MLQHHGAATRLLDCTFNAYIALWFACRDRPDDWGVIAGFDLARAWPILTADQRDLPMGELLHILDEDATFGVWRPASLSPRIAAQQGFFVFSVVVDEVWGSMRFRGDQLQETGSIPGLNLFAVSPELKAQFNMVWEEQFGYAEERMFPDLDGFARVHAAAARFPGNFYDGPNLLP